MMGACDINGNALVGIYDISGTDLSLAYDLNGNVVFNRGSTPTDYTNYTITNLGGTVGQGCDVYNSVLATWSGESTTVSPIAQACTLRLYNVSTITKITDIVEESIVTHGNDLTFTDEFYEQSDEYPMFYIDGKLCRIVNDGISVVSRLILPTISTYNLGYGWGISESENILYCIGYKNGYTYTEGNDILFATFDMSDMTDNGNGSYTPTLIAQATLDWLPCIQGAAYHDGYLWIVCGISNADAYIYAVDVETGDINISINLNTTIEPEGIAWAYNSTDGWYIITGSRSGLGYRKIVFS